MTVEEAYKILINPKMSKIECNFKVKNKSSGPKPPKYFVDFVNEQRQFNTMVLDFIKRQEQFNNYVLDVLKRNDLFQQHVLDVFKRNNLK